MLSIIVNGSPRNLACTQASVAELVSELALTGKRVAVEKNGEIVPRGLHATTLVESGDRIEIVAAVGGG